MSAQSYRTVHNLNLTFMEKIGKLSTAAAKRGMDILFSTLGLVFLSPFFLIIALKLKSEGPGPIFYRGSRLGIGGNEFGILKFRTMYERPESYNGPKVTAGDDDRITPTGRWLRDTKLNELPQLWNVLVGQMSLVGPRPEDPEFAKRWPAKLRSEILSIRPGITSPASISYRDEEKLLSGDAAIDNYLNNIVPDKLRLDSLYVRHHTLLTDLDTIFWTFIVLLPQMGKIKVPESWLFGGPLTRFNRRYISWFAIDFFLALASISALGLIWRLKSPLDVGWLTAGIMAVCLALALSFFNWILGLKSVAWSRPAIEDALKLFVSALLVGLSYFLLQEFYGLTPLLPDEFIIAAEILTLFIFVVARYRLRLITGLASRWVTLRGSGYGAGERVLIVGAGEGGEFASWILNHPDFRRFYKAAGFVDDDPLKQGLRFDGLKVLGTTGDIPALVKSQDIGVIFYAINKLGPEDQDRILGTCQKTGLPLVLISEIIENLHYHFKHSALKVPVDRAVQ